MNKTTIAAANIKISHDKSKNLSRFLELIDEAGSQNVDVLVLPEMALQDYADFSFNLGTKESAEQKNIITMKLSPFQVLLPKKLARLRRNIIWWYNSVWLNQLYTAT